MENIKPDTRDATAPPLVSILIPAYNAAKYIAITCRSLQAQTDPNFEVIILDDGSSDETLAILEPFKSDPRFQIRSRKPNSGLAATWRELLYMANGKYWCCPGADDILFPEFMERRVSWMEKNPNAVFVHGPMEFINEDGAVIPRPEQPWPILENLDAARTLALFYQANFVYQPSTMVRMEVTRKILPFFKYNWVYAPDWDLWMLHVATGGKMLWDVKTVCQYRLHAHSLTGDTRLQGLRGAEFRLVPMCALKAATQYSELAREDWRKWSKYLYRLWLWRAVKLKRKGALKPEWIKAASAAYYGDEDRGSNLTAEVCRNAAGIVAALVTQRSVINRAIKNAGTTL